MSETNKEKSMGQIGWEAFADSIGGGPVWFGDGRRDEKAWEDAAQAVTLESDRRHQLEMGYYPSMLEKSEEENCDLRDAVKRARELLSKAKPFCVGKEGDEAYCNDAGDIRRSIVEFLIKAPVL